MAATKPVALALEIALEVTTRVDVGGLEVIERFAKPWQILCRETQCAPFHRPEWIVAHLRVFEPNAEVVLLTASAGKRLLAVLPLVRKRCWDTGIPVTKLTAAANVHSVRFDILRSPCAAGESSIPALWGELKRLSGWHVLELPFFPQDGVCASLLALAAGDGYHTRSAMMEESPILRMCPEANGKLTWLGGTSRHFRHELRRYARVLEEQGGAKPIFTRWTRPDPALWQQFLELEAAGWKGRKGSAINCEAPTRSFYSEIARLGADGGYFCLHTLQVNGVLAAGAFSVMTPGCFYPMKIAFNEALRRGGPGHLLFNSILEECAGQGIPQLFFGGDKDHYKDLWTQETLPHFIGHIFASDLRSQLAYHSKTKVLPRLGKLRRSFKERLRWNKLEKTAPAAKPSAS